VYSFLEYQMEARERLEKGIIKGDIVKK